jgi:hypothetical protein
VYVREESITEHKKFFSYLIDMSTSEYRNKRVEGGTADKEEWDTYKEELDKQHIANEQMENAKSVVKKKIHEDHQKSKFYKKRDLFQSTEPVKVLAFDPIAKVKAGCTPSSRKKRSPINETKSVEGPSAHPPNIHVPQTEMDQSDRKVFKRATANPATNIHPTSWTVSDGGCHHILQLMPNSVLRGHGGRISL